MLVLLAVAAVIVSVGVGGVAAAQGDDASPPAAVYADSTGEVTVLYANGTTVQLGVTAEVVGDLADLDGDRHLEVPIVDGSGNLRLVDTSGAVQTLVSGDAATSKTLLPTGDWNDDGQKSVFYENTSDGKLYRVQPGETPRPVVGPNGKPLATNTPVGLADYDSDGDEDLVFTGSSSTVKLYDGDSVSSTGFSSFGSNNGIGLGSPADFDGDGTPRVPYVTGSGNLALLAADGTKSKLTTSYGGAAKAPVAAANWTGDSRLEVLHVNAGSDAIYYASTGGDVGPVYSSSGSRISASVGSGLAATPKPVPPRIDQFDASNPADRNLTVQFTSSERLTDIAVELTGPANSTLTEADFEATGSGPYQYTATRTVSTDGDYTATLVVAEDTQGLTGASGQQATVTVQTQAPKITNATLLDVADSNGVVAGGDEVRVTATVSSESSLSSVTADASMFGVETVELTRSGEQYTGVFTVQADDVSSDGAATVTVTATDEYGHTTTAASSDLVVDTTRPTAKAGPDVTVEQGSKLVLNAGESTDNSRIARYIWQFGNGVTKHGIAPSHVYTEPGTYTVTLTVVDAANHSATDTVTVEVTKTGDETKQTSSGDQTSRSGSTGTLETEVARDVDGAVTIRATNMAANSPVSVTYRGATPLNESLLVQGIEFVPLRDGNTSMTVHSPDGRPAGAPALSAREDLSVLDYIEIDHSIDDQNVRDVSLTVVVPKHRLPDGADQSTVAVFRLEDGQWKPYEATKTGETAKAIEYRAQVPGLSTFAVGVRHNQIDVVRANLEDTSLTVDEDTTVSAVLKNDGESRTTRRISLVVNGTAVTRKQVSLDPGEQRTVTFAYNPEQSGNYSISVDNASAGSVLVTPVQTESPPMLPLGVGVAALALLSGLVAYRRRTAVTEEVSTLPDAQRQALVVAYETGYFDVPQESALRDIAGRLNVSEQEASERLRRGLRTLIESTPADDRSDPVDAAYEMGYFQIPRATTLEELSQQLQIPEQEAAEKLRSDLKRVIETEFMDDQ